MPIKMNIYAEVIQPYVTGSLPGHVAINTYCFSGTQDYEPYPEPIDFQWCAALVQEKISAFYTNVSGPYDMGRYLNQDMLLEDVVTRFRLIQPLEIQPLSAVIVETNWDRTSASAASLQNLPLENSVCMSYVAGGEETVGVPLRRRRGRVYIGPLSVNAIDTGGETGYPFGMVSTGLADLLRTQGEILAAPINTITPGTGLPETLTWSVWSRAGQALYPITAGWVNREFDTQRRREMPIPHSFDWTWP